MTLDELKEALREVFEPTWENWEVPLQHASMLGMAANPAGTVAYGNPKWGSLQELLSDPERAKFLRWYGLERPGHSFQDMVHTIQESLKKRSLLGK